MVFHIWPYCLNLILLEGKNPRRLLELNESFRDPSGLKDTAPLASFTMQRTLYHIPYMNEQVYSFHAMKIQLIIAVPPYNVL